MKPVYFDTEIFSGHSYGGSHPMRLERLSLTTDLLRAYEALPDDQVHAPKAAPEEELLRIHTREYLEVLNQAPGGAPESLWRAGLGQGDNPVFPGLYEVARYSVGASLEAARLVAEGECFVAFNIAGGMHHAMADRASGFCYLNDPAVAIAWLRARGLRVAYIDIDAHHGDGVQAAFYDSADVLTVSLHQNGHTLFPGSGFETGMGRGEGVGYALNVPLPPHAGDECFVRAFDAVVPPALAAFKPEVVVTQLGVDSLRTDPLTMLDLTTHAFEHAVRFFRANCPRWVALGGGGYDLGNVPRAWALAWALMNELDLPEELPTAWRQQARQYGVTTTVLRDAPGLRDEPRFLDEVDRVVGYLHEHAFPRLGAQTP